jgi:hypothetical protein
VADFTKSNQNLVLSVLTSASGGHVDQEYVKDVCLADKCREGKEGGAREEKNRIMKRGKGKGKKSRKNRKRMLIGT